MSCTKEPYIKDLFQRIASGDELAFSSAFNAYKKQIFSVALKFLKTDYEAKEILQDVFIIIWKRRESLTAINDPQAYLFTITYNLIYSCLKKKAIERKKQIALNNFQHNSHVDEGDKLQYKEQERQLQLIISQLPRQQQLIYKLSTQEGLSRNEIAHHLHISSNTVKNHLQQAVKFIRTHFLKKFHSN